MRRTRREILGIAVTLGGIGAATALMIPFRRHMSVDTAALVLVIPIVIGVAVGGFPASPVGVVVGFLAYDFFFIPPYGIPLVAGTRFAR